MILHNIIQIIFLLSGATALMAALFNWEWFFTTRNAEPVVKKLGRGKSRLLYGTAGVVFIFAAIFFYYKVKGIA